MSKGEGSREEGSRPVQCALPRCVRVLGYRKGEGRALRALEGDDDRSGLISCVQRRGGRM